MVIATLLVPFKRTNMVAFRLLIYNYLRKPKNKRKPLLSRGRSQVQHHLEHGLLVF